MSKKSWIALVGAGLIAIATALLGEPVKEIVCGGNASALQAPQQ